MQCKGENMEHTRKTDKDRKSEREKLKKRRQQQQYLLIGAAVLVILVIVLLIVLLPSGDASDPSAGAVAPGIVTDDNGSSQTTTKPQSGESVPMDANDPESEFTDPIEDTSPPAEQPEYEVDFAAPVELYWNVDRGLYANESGTAVREPDSNGNYKIRFSYKGELLEKTVADKTLVETIDTMDVMKLFFDEQGIVVGAMGSWDAAAELAMNIYVQSATEGLLTVNTQSDMAGTTVYFVLDSESGIYDVRPDAQTPGAALQPGDLKQGDILRIYGDFEGNVVYVYVTGHAEG